jgi:hypothetical protein
MSNVNASSMYAYASEVAEKCSSLLSSMGSVSGAGGGLLVFDVLELSGVFCVTDTDDVDGVEDMDDMDGVEDMEGGDELGRMGGMAGMT